MRYLIIPDIHNKIERATAIIDTVPFDNVILLGDIFDSFGDGDFDAIKSALFLAEKINDDRFIILHGNHDISYAYPNTEAFYCSGFREHKAKAIGRTLDIVAWRNKARLFHRVNDVIFSHSGYSKRFHEYLFEKGYINDISLSINTIEMNLNYIEAKARRDADLPFSQHPILLPGIDRGGPLPYGGILWGDISNFHPIEGITQVFGHSEIRPHTLGVRLQSFRVKKPSPHLTKIRNKVSTAFPEIESRDINHLYRNGSGIGIDSGLNGFSLYDSDKHVLSVYKVKFTRDKHASSLIESYSLIFSIDTSTNTVL